MDYRAIPPTGEVAARLSLGNFPPATSEQWASLVNKVLARGGAAADADPLAALSTVTEDGIALRPLYAAGDVPPSNGESGVAQAKSTRLPGGWDVRALHRDPDPVRTNAAVLADLESGATSLWLMLGDGGMPVEALPRALDGVYLDLAPVVLDAGAQTESAARALMALVDDRGVARAVLSGSLGADPIGARARRGSPVELGELASLVDFAAGSQLTAVTVDGTVYNDAGGSDSDELAVAAACGVAYVRALSDAGIDDPFAHVEFRYAVGVDQFNGIAKLRAARRIWSRIAQLCGSTVAHRQHAVTSAAMMTRHDPWVNLLRCTIGCFAAAAGGAQAITVRPFDDALGLPDDFARRIARNTQAIVHDEAHLGRVLDPAAGSWYVETLTDLLAAAAWDKFTALERAGGALAALDSGVLGELLAASETQRAERIDRRTQPITGVSVSPNLDETLPKRAAAPSTAGNGALPTLRYAEPFEALWERAEAHRAAGGGRLRVALLTLGPAAAYGARVGFAREVLAVAGIEAVAVEFDEARLPVDVGPVVCLCSSDAVYAERGPAAVTALRTAGVERILVAGRVDPALAVDGFVFAGCNVHAVLNDTLEALAGAA